MQLTQQHVTRLLMQFNNTINHLANEAMERRLCAVAMPTVADYSDCITWVLENSAKYSTIEEFARAALCSELDTMVREDMCEAIESLAVQEMLLEQLIHGG
jgi:hypothetical protein